MSTKRKGGPAGFDGEKIKALQKALVELGFSVRDDEGTLGPSTRRALREFRKGRGLKVTDGVDEKTARLVTAFAEVVRQSPTDEARRRTLEVLLRERPPARGAAGRDANRFVVRGRVTGTDGRPREGLRVRAFDKDLVCAGERARHREQPLGSAVTDASGQYEIAYGPRQFGRTERGSADLVVRVFGRSQKPLAESPARYNARPVEIINFVVEARGRERSEFERVEEALAPFLKCITNLKDEDVACLAGETGLPALHVAFCAVARRHAQATELPAAGFYGSFRQGGPTALLPFLLQQERTVRRALTASLSANIIPASFGREVGRFVDALGDRIGSHVLSEDGSTRGLLEAAGLSAELQTSFLKSYARRNGSVPEFWKSLRGSALGDKVDGLQSVLQLALLTGNNVPLVKRLRDRGFRTPKDVVRLGAEGLRQLIGGSKEILQAIPSVSDGETAGEKATRAAEEITEVLNAAFPTAFLSVGLEKEPPADLALVRHVVSKNPRLDLRQPVNGKINWDGLNAAQRKKARASLEALRRELSAFPELAPDDFLGADGPGAQKLDNRLRRDVARFLANAPALELRDEHLDRFIAREGEKLFEGVQDPEATARQLKRFQRVMRVAPRHEHSMALLEEGLDSARAITGLTQAAFLDLFESRLGGRTQARAYYFKAWQVSETVVGMTTSLVQSVNDLLPRAILPAPDVLKQRPDLTSLFGSAVLCQCRDCRSVYSPAAYLVDLLQFINPKVMIVTLTGNKTPLSVLRQRRPDIEHIPLTCENTHTPLPYLDLVNEILEFYVAHEEELTGGLTAEQKEALAKEMAKDTGDATAEELSVNPQYILDAAYEKLQEAVGSPLLPLHRPLEVSRLYLEHLGTSRAQVLKVFRKAGVPDEADIWNESLKISAAERDIIVGDDERPVQEFYGYRPDTELAVFLDEKGDTQTEDWTKNLSRVREFLKRTGTTYDELVELLETKFINGQSPFMFLKEPGEQPQCDLSKTTLVNLNSRRRRRIHRFLRLARKLGWTIPELDRVISLPVFGVKTITKELLRKLAQARALETDLKMKRPALLSLWAPLETGGEDPLYLKLFQNKAVLNPPDPDFELNADKTQLLSAEKKLSEKADFLLSALRFSSEELAAVRAAAGLGDEGAELNLENLSHLYRHAALARALKLKIKEFLSLLVLTADNPFQPAEPAPTLAFVERVRRVQASRFSVAHLDYLYRSTSDTAVPLEPQPEEMNQLIKELREGLQRIIQETSAPLEPTEDVLRAKLTDVLDAKLIEPPKTFAQHLDEAISVINGIDSDADPQEQQEKEALIEAFVQKHFASFLDADEAIDVLLDTSITDKEERKKRNRQFVLEPLMLHLREVLKRGFVKKTLSEAVQIESGVGELLLETILRAETNPAARAIADFLPLADVAATPEDGDEVVPSEIKNSFTRLHKAALLVNGFKISREELEYMSAPAHQADFQDFDLNALPLDSANFSPALFRQWERLQDLFALRDSLPEGEAKLFDVFKAATGESASAAAEALEKLKQATAWDPEQLDSLVGPEGFNLASAADFANETKLLPLRDCLALSRRVGLSCAELFEWAETEPDAEGARQIVNAAKSKYAPEQWPSIAKPLNDLLREKQRTALVAYLLTQPSIVMKGINDTGGLFEYFLIDVEMSACMDTSRIKQAISSVQLFIQRCLMNLERDVSPSLIDADQWEWIKHYRIWEANRKVFLYPENWIEPELRDNKTPFFEELETQLLQHDLTRETAEQAFLAYLQKLDEVAKLEICGLHTQREDEDGETTHIVHVFGRTPDTPHALYHRQLLNHTTWTPWQKVEMDVDSDHLIPFTYNRRLYLFWPVFEEKPDKKAKLEGPFIQSEEHWRWRAQHEEWEDVHKQWEKANAAFEEWEKSKSDLETLIGDLNDILSELSGQAAAVTQELIDDLDGELKELKDNPVPDPGDEPREPTEPPFSIQPALTKWQIRLAWSEFYQGKWSAKKTSSVSITSPLVAVTLKDYGDYLFDLGGGGFGGAFAAFLAGASSEGVVTSEAIGPDNTIVDVFLPAPRDHFFRPEVDEESGDLLIRAYRRYEQKYQVLDVVIEGYVKKYERVGRFRLSCGAKVRASNKLEELPYESLPRPDGTENRFMGLADVEAENLTFTPDGAEPLPVLRSIPPGAGNFTLALDTKDQEFSLKPAFSRFFYQDKLKAYMASYKPDFPFTLLINEDNVTLVSDQSLHDSLIEATKVSTTLALTSGTQYALLGDGQDFDGESTSLAPIPSGVQTMKAGQAANVASHAEVVSLLLGQWLGKVADFDGFSLEGIGMEPFLKFDIFFHPHVCDFLKQLYRKGVPGLLARSTQQLDNDPTGDPPVPGNAFTRLYKPGQIVHIVSPREDVDFGGGAYAVYNWELFFHVPMLIAESLRLNQRFEEALEWFHYIFNPTTSSVETLPRRFWNTLPFYQNSHPEKHQIQQLLLALGSDEPTLASLRDEVERQIREWRENPFNPHLIARLRITAYQKNVVMRYIDTLLDRADLLFTLDTMETLNEATLYYVLAADILGPRPQIIPSPAKIRAKTYARLKKEGLDDFSNALVAFENEVPYAPPSPSSIQTGALLSGDKMSTALKPATGVILKTAPETLYFCIPPNYELLEYWDRVEDRLFKLRHCLNIEGVARKLPLFEPPIDPALLVKARAAGLDLASVLSDIHAPLPCYRFPALLQKALEVTSEVKSLGAQLLSTLEKKDAERLASLRASHESALLKAVREVKRQQIEEAEQNLEGLHKSKAVVEARRDFYKNIEKISDYEQENMDDLNTAHVFNMIAQGLQTAVATGFLTPNITTGTSGSFSSPVFTVKFGGSNMGAAAQALAGGANMIAAQFSHDAQMASIRGGYERRWQEWKHQENLAEKELAQINRQIVAAEIRQAVAEKELENHERQIENAAEVEAFLRDKYSNERLYVWMQGQVSKVFFQAYKLAYDLARRAERAYRFEFGLTESDFIQFGYWDNLRSGLLSGEKLYLDLKRLDAAYLDRNKRHYELSKRVSLLLHDPAALIELKQTGQCNFTLEEWLFNLDYPSHYDRRIKSVSLTIPCVVGPYTNINCTLILLSSKIRTSPAHEPYEEKADEPDPRFVTSFAATQSIATSHGQNDSGMFELNFRDERYLPFEGAGVISSNWQLDLTENFDFDTITDVILHINYTAREGGAQLGGAAKAALDAHIAEAENFPLTRLFSARHEFPNDWHRFLSPAGETGDQTLTMTFTKERFPFLFRGKTIKVHRIELRVKIKPEFSDALRLSFQQGTAASDDEMEVANLNGLLHAVQPVADWEVPAVPEDAKWTLTAWLDAGGGAHQRFDSEAIEEVYVLCHYTCS